MEDRLSEKDLLELGNDTSLTAKERWIIAPYAWSFEGVLFEEYHNLALKENDDGFVWSDRRLKSFGQSDPAFFRDRIREPNLFRAKVGIKERRMRQLKQTKDPLTGKFRKAALHREPNRFRAKGGTRERRVKQLKPMKDPLTGKFKKAAEAQIIYCWLTGANWHMQASHRLT